MKNYHGVVIGIVASTNDPAGEGRLHTQAAHY